MKRNKFGKNLKATLRSMNLTQAQLAKKTGLTQACISQIINGKREPQLATVLLILKSVPLTFDQLVSK